mmetsp:Transcript_24401/g.57238  ORF Transcript_24401/g.57238 Transcript_24401/m.57238 type:complete len:1081 (+) Transcript_24401:148-3390(+)
MAPHHTPNLLLQAALVSTIHPGQPSANNPTAISEATRYLQSWVECDVSDGMGWAAAAELVASFYPAAGRYGGTSGAGDPGVVERAIIAHHSSGGGGQLSDHLLRTTAGAVRSLLLTLLNSKIRTGSAAGFSPETRLFDGVWSGLLWFDNDHQSAAASTSGEVRLLCATIGALAVRVAGGIPALVQKCNTNGPPCPTPSMALQVLAKIPGEASDCPTRSTADVEADMGPCLGYVLDVMGQVLVDNGGSATNAKLALQVLSNWARPCHVTLTRLANTVAIPSSPDRGSLLDVLVRLLSAPEPSQQPQQTVSLEVLDMAAQALMVSVVKGSDLGTPTRQSVATALLGAIPSRGFLVHPLTVASEAVWEGDECVCSLANLAVTIATEEIDLVVAGAAPGCAELIEILMGLQVHRVQAAAIAPLEAWLAIQDVPLSNRHPSLHQELFARVVQALLVRISYPPDFTSWEEDETDALDRQEFEEMRRLVSDVLTTSYFLLRVGYVEGVIASVAIRQSSWEAVEAALFCLRAVGRDVSDETKKRTEGGIKSAEQLVVMVQQLCSVPLNQQRVCLRKAIAGFLGIYARVFNLYATDSILEVLLYLKACIENGAANDGAKAVRLIMIGCGKSLIRTATQVGSPGDSTVQTGSGNVPAALTAIMDAILTHGEEDSVRLVAEGSTRLCMTMPNSALVRSSLIAVVEPIVRCSGMALEFIQSAQSQQQPDAAQLDSSYRALSCSLCAFKEVCRFCDDHSPPSSNRGDNSNSSHPLAEVLTGVWPLLTGISASPLCRSHYGIMSACLAVHSALLSSAPDLIAPHFAATVTFIVQLYEEQHTPSALDYVAAAVEHFGSTNGGDFGDLTELLAHITRCTTSYLSSRPPLDCPFQIEAYFDACRRYLLFYPRALVACQEFGNTFGLGVACMNECQGNDCRAALLYLAQIIGHKNLRVSTDTTLVLQAASGTIDVLIAQHGEAICKKCVSSLSGAAPQMLCPAYSECLFATLAYLCSVEGGEQLANQLMSASLEDDAKRLTLDTRQRLVSILLGFAKDSTNRRSKPQAKLLLSDYGKLCKGEATPEILQAYSYVAYAG